MTSASGLAATVAGNLGRPVPEADSSVKVEEMDPSPALAQVGGANALNYALVGTIGVVVLALLLDLILVGVGRLTIPRGIRA
mgnify:CR=1 FL=1